MGTSMKKYIISLLLAIIPFTGVCMSNQKKYDNSSIPAIDGRPYPEQRKPGFFEMFSIGRKIFFQSAERSPMGKLPEVKPDMASFTATAGTPKFIWFGHSSILLNIDGRMLLIDPVFSSSASPFSFINRRFQPAVLKLKELPEIDVILISHNHYDHLDKKTVKFFRDKNTVFLVPSDVGRYLEDWGIPGSRIHELDWYQSIALKGIDFTAAPARHFSGRGLFDHNGSLWASWIIRGKTGRIFFSGDSSYGGHFREIGSRFGPFDLAFIENGQYDKRWPDAHMRPEDTVQAAVDVKARAFVPVHWGMFILSLHHWADPVRRSCKLAGERNVTIITPKLGEMVDTSSSYTGTTWWEPFIQATERSEHAPVSGVKTGPDSAVAEGT